MRLMPSVATKAMPSLATEDMSSVAPESVSFVATEVMYSVFTGDVPSAPPEDVFLWQHNISVCIHMRFYAEVLCH